MDDKTQVNLKMIMSLQVIKDLMIEQGITTSEDFKKRLDLKIETSGLSEEYKETLRRNI